MLILSLLLHQVLERRLSVLCRLHSKPLVLMTEFLVRLSLSFTHQIMVLGTVSQVFLSLYAQLFVVPHNININKRPRPEFSAILNPGF